MILKTNKQKKWEARLDNVNNFFKTMEEWGDQRDFKTLPRAIMPYDVFVLKENKTDVFCVSLHIGGHIGFAIFPLSNKKAKPLKGGLKYLYSAMYKYCRLMDIKVLITTANPEGYKRILKSMDWMPTPLVDEDYYIKILK